jgi:transcriptional regulator with XRE-family HTH domain
MDLTQKVLAKHMNVADSTLSYWEMGRYEPDTKALMKLSRFFRVPIDYILGGDFPKWDTDGNEMQYHDINPSGSDISVSESNAAYGLNKKTERSFGPVAVDCQIYELLESTILEETKPATPSETTYGSRNTQAGFNQIEFEGLTHEEIDLLAEYAMFIKSRRKKL